MAEKTPSKSNITLQLGDIIKINAPTDTNIHDQVYYIEYIDSTQIDLLDQDKSELKLYINESGKFTNESIQDIELLSRADYPGYAQQNELVKGVWANYYFSGDEPFVITGEIVNVVEDQIEIRPLNSDESLYIDFEYKGIPKDLDLERIVKRAAPMSVQEKEQTLRSDAANDDAEDKENEDGDDETKKAESKSKFG